MLRPSYSDLMEVLTEQGNISQEIASRYTIIVATSKRARRLVAGEESKIKDADPEKAVSNAVREMFEGHIKIKKGAPIQPRNIILEEDEVY